MNQSSNGLLRLFGQRDLAGHGESHFSMSHDEIRTILSASEKEGMLNPEETKMIAASSTSTSTACARR